MLQRSFHHFDLSSSHFHLALTRGSLISYQRILIYCRSTEDIHPSIYRKWMGSSHFTQHMSAHINTQGDGASEHLGHCIIRCTTFIQPRLGWRKKQMKEEKDGVVWRVKRELLCVKAWPNAPSHAHTHIWKEDTISLCVLSKCVWMCTFVHARAGMAVPPRSR